MAPKCFGKYQGMNQLMHLHQTPPENALSRVFPHGIFVGNVDIDASLHAVEACQVL